MVEVGTRVWSTAWFTAVARLTCVGVFTGVLAAAALVVLVVVLGGGSLLDAGAPLLFAVPVGAACAVPVALLSAATGLRAAARRPQRRGVAIALLLVWPTALTALVLGFFAVTNDYAFGPTLAGFAGLVGVIAAAVVGAYAWVTAPLR